MDKIVKNRFIKKENGFTLVELLIALSLLAVLVLAVTGMLAGMPRFYRDLRSGEERKEEVWTALNFMARELRSAKKFNENSTEKQLNFVDEKDQQISYRHNTSSNQLERRVGTGTWVPMIDNVRASDWEITYRVSNNNDPARFSQITLRLSEESITIRPRMYRGEDTGSGWFE